MSLLEETGRHPASYLTFDFVVNCIKWSTILIHLFFIGIMSVHQSFEGKVITVAGASRGIGLATVKYLLARGAIVSISSSSDANLSTAQEELSTEFLNLEGRLLARVCDVTKLEMVVAWIAETMTRFGRIDGCANVSGREQRYINNLTDMPLNDWHGIIDVNLHGVFHLLREEMKVISEGGSIVNVASIASKYASPGFGAYIASKHALIGLTRAAAYEGGPRGVRVNALCPGMVRSQMTTTPFHLPDGSSFVVPESSVPQLFKRFGEPEEIAASICFLLGDESKFVTKAEWYIDGGFTGGSYTG
ncbi:Short-chain dehydrogenase/reductase aba4 [Paramyrothecium foliicola]|nr:Short-chain dehydrogenase/reductase aba4 [Paramyrothecium foliicola]